MDKSKAMVDLGDFANWLRAHDKSALTIKAYVSDIRLFSQWFEEHTGEEMRPEVVTPLDVRSVRDHLQTKGYAPSTIVRKLASLSVFFDWAREKGFVQFDPTERIRRPKHVAPAPKWLDRSERHALLREAQKEAQIGEVRAKGDRTQVSLWRSRRDLAVIVLLLNAGLRVSELASLTLSDVEVNQRSGRVTVVGKGNKKRTIPLNAEARQAIGAWLEVRPEVETDALFVTQIGTALAVRSVQWIVEKYAESAGLEGVTAHTLRHTFGKGLVDAGVSLDKVAMLLGHTSINTTKIYTTPSEADLEEAVEKLV